MMTALWTLTSPKHNDKKMMRQGWNVLPPLSPYLSAGCLKERKGSAQMNDKKRDYLIMTIATVVILILLILFYTALSFWAQ